MLAYEVVDVKFTEINDPVLARATLKRFNQKPPYLDLCFAFDDNCRVWRQAESPGQNLKSVVFQASGDINGNEHDPPLFDGIERKWVRNGNAIGYGLAELSRLQTRSLLNITREFYKNKRSDCNRVRKSVFSGVYFYFEQPETIDENGTFSSAGIAAVKQCGGTVVDSEDEYQKLLAELGRDSVFRVTR